MLVHVCLCPSHEENLAGRKVAFSMPPQQSIVQWISNRSCGFRSARPKYAGKKGKKEKGSFKLRDTKLDASGGPLRSLEYTSYRLDPFKQKGAGSTKHFLSSTKTPFPVPGWRGKTNLHKKHISLSSLCAGCQSESISLPGI